MVSKKSLGNVGKTSVLRILKNGHEGENLSTDGIKISNFDFSVGDKQVVLSAWDFGGQEIYYPTHQFFLTPCSVYLVVFKINDLNWRIKVEYWLNLIRQVDTFKPSVMLVGTHKDDEIYGQPDQIAALTRIIQAYQETYSNIKEFEILSCKNQEGFQSLNNKLETILRGERILKTLVPYYYIQLEKMIDELRTKRPYLTWEEFCVQVESSSSNVTDIDNLVIFLRNVGTLIKFNDLVILDPQYLANLMSTIITVSSTLTTGIINKSQLRARLLAYDTIIHDELIDILCCFDIMFPRRLDAAEQTWVVPTLLPSEFSIEWSTPEAVVAFQTNSVLDTVNLATCREFRRSYRLGFSPIGFFGRIIAKLHHLTTCKIIQIWREGILLRDKQEIAFLHFNGRHQELNVSVKSQLRSVLLSELIWKIESVVDSYYSQEQDNISRVFLCPHCIELSKNLKEEERKITEFSFQECMDAALLGDADKAVLFCNGIQVPLSDIAPEFSLSHMNLQGTITLGEELGSGAFGGKYHCTSHLMSIYSCL